jgi:hypothetical protein
LVHPSKKLPGSALIIREMVLTRQIYTKTRKYTMFYRGFPMESIMPGGFRAGQDKPRYSGTVPIRGETPGRSSEL